MWSTAKQNQQTETQRKITNFLAWRYQKTKDKMAIGNPHTSIITLNVNGLNSPIKRHRAQIGSKNKPNNMLPLGDIKAEKTKR